LLNIVLSDPEYAYTLPPEIGQEAVRRLTAIAENESLVFSSLGYLQRRFYTHVEKEIYYIVVSCLHQANALLPDLCRG